jgi:formate hydrogenlyase subunit 3/multisubunit Na+/H+ antiporter MnhD subunit
LFGLGAGLVFMWTLALIAGALAVFVNDHISRILGYPLMIVVGLWMLGLIMATFSTAWKALQVLVRGPRPEDYV